ncbi:hypothetical protein ABIE56_000166 [Luteibacter sp. 621]|uniref:helix-turn-helix domain-containing protein n=1 Tax=Luteibacter sp. 621 TaxID=3373916 RepID=UPI003D1E59D3
MFAKQAGKVGKNNRPAMRREDMDVFVEALRDEGFTVSVDASERHGGPWFIDVATGQFQTTAMWSSADGFGLFAGEVGYGDRPSETFLDVSRAVTRIKQMHNQWLAKGYFLSPSLADLRQLLNTSQEELGRLAHLKQSAVSRFEGRDDVKLSSLVAYVSALGGRVELRVHFDDMHLSLAIPGA